MLCGTGSMQTITATVIFNLEVVTNIDLDEFIHNPEKVLGIK